MSFGKELRKLRKRAGLTLREVTDRVGISIVYLSQIETGERVPPEVKVIDAILLAVNAHDKLSWFVSMSAEERAEITFDLKGVSSRVRGNVARLATILHSKRPSMEFVTRLEELLFGDEMP